MIKKFTLTVLAIIFALGMTQAQVTISDDGSGTGTTTWTADNTYLLDGFVFVNDGQTLTIEPGTVIKGMAGTGADASALVVAKGATLIAEGTDTNPIIFTFEGDPLDGSTPYTTVGQWGGVIVLGDARLNSVPGETQIEGIPDTEPRGVYGGENDEDNSGSLKYISIRHGGTDIGAGNEINGLTLGGVGSETVIEHIEVVSNQDDGIEIFGGTANIKWAVTAFCGDDSFDYDEGWRGKGQFWVTVQDPNGDGNGDRGGEHDGGTDPEDGMPYAHPSIYNASFIGRGIDAGKRALTFRDNAGGEYHNSIFSQWGKGIDIENLASGEDTYSRFENGTVNFSGNIFYGCNQEGTGATGADLFKITMGSGGWDSDSDSIAQHDTSTAAFAATFATNNNEVLNPDLEYVVGAGTFGLDLVPAADVSTTDLPSDSWYDAAEYRGAFEPNTSNWNWMYGGTEEAPLAWTFLAQNAFLKGVQIISVDEMAKQELNVYPNPTSGQFQIEVPLDFINGNLTIYNTLGAIVVQERIQTANGNFNLEGLAKGIYTLQLIKNYKSLTTQVILK